MAGSKPAALPLGDTPIKDSVAHYEKLTTENDGCGAGFESRHIAGIKTKLSQPLFKVAGVLGFEPRYGGIKTRCLTAWRHPN